MCGERQDSSTMVGGWKKTSVALELEQLKRAKVYAFMHDMTVKQLIHDAIDEYLLNHQ